MQSVQTTHFVRYLVISGNLVRDTQAYKNLAVHPGNEGNCFGVAHVNYDVGARYDKNDTLLILAKKDVYLLC